MRSSAPTQAIEAQWAFGRDEYWTCHDCIGDTLCTARVIQRLEYAAERGHVKAAEDLSIVYRRAASMPDGRSKHL